MSWSNILAGAHLKCMVNGRLLGWTSGIHYRIRTPARRAQGIDSAVTFELMPTTYDVAGSMEVYRGRAQGGAEGLGMAAFAKDLLKQKYSTIELVDRLSGDVVASFSGCLVTEQSWDARPKSLVTGNFTFEGVGYSNEASSA